MHVSQATSQNELLSLTLPFEEIKEIHKRWYELQDQAVEVFLTNGNTCLMALESTKVSPFKLNCYSSVVPLPINDYMCFTEIWKLKF